MHLVHPSAAMLPSFIDALEKGWSPRNVDSERARLATLARIEAGREAFLAEFVDGATDGPPIELPDGRTVPRLPDLVRWMWDGEFCGVINLRWQEGTDALPPHTLGHVGYAVVPWKRGRGYASAALRGILPLARSVGLRRIELTTTADNVASIRTILNAGGRHVRDMTDVVHHAPDEIVGLYEIEL
ncbi:Acetyltransferase (GNAT) family protein [Tsuneonella dongtanensis]|uniref:Acetyltransferase (GNAT) family protein n=2 Tax=Tsuneonella dongtanensis TaxID=692370 RepID=A0A1B2A9Q4_9SPHN|nr:Acetyltransferase (GNAT) family protein [Tsuneonella dongtanensis]